MISRPRPQWIRWKVTKSISAVVKRSQWKTAAEIPIRLWRVCRRHTYSSSAPIARKTMCPVPAMAAKWDRWQMIGDKWGFHILYFTAAKHVTISFQLIWLIYFLLQALQSIINCLKYCLNCENKHGSFHRLALLYIVDLSCTSTCRFMMSWFFSCCWHVDGTCGDMNWNETVNVLGTQHPLARSHSWVPCRTAEWSDFFSHMGFRWHFQCRSSSSRRQD